MKSLRNFKFFRERKRKANASVDEEPKQVPLKPKRIRYCFECEQLLDENEGRTCKECLRHNRDKIRLTLIAEKALCSRQAAKHV